MNRKSIPNDNPMVSAHFYTLLTGVCALCEAYSPGTRMSGLFCVTSFRTRGCTPCDVCTSIPCGLDVRKQHKMLFAASKFESD